MLCNVDLEPLTRELDPPYLDFDQKLATTREITFLVSWTTGRIVDVAAPTQTQ